MVIAQPQPSKVRFRRLLGAAAAVAVAALSLTACNTPAPTNGPTPPGVGGRYALQLVGHNQVVVVTGDSVQGTGSTLTEYDRTTGGWVEHGSPVRVWNGRSGWTYNPISGTGYSPIGVFSLGAAGGYAPNPGTRLAYQYSPSYYSLVYNGVRTFNHVVAIGYNHVPGAYPSDPRTPMGTRYSNGVWMHTSHNSPSRACVGVPDNVLADTMRWLNPAAAPVIVMGPRSSITAN